MWGKIGVRTSATIHLTVGLPSLHRFSYTGVSLNDDFHQNPTRRSLKSWLFHVEKDPDTFPHNTRDPNPFRAIIMTANLADPKEYQNIFHWAETQQSGAIPSFGLRKNDPYEVDH